MSPFGAICVGFTIVLLVFGDVTDAAPKPQFGRGFGGGYGGGFGRPYGGGFKRPYYGRIPNISYSKSISIGGGGFGGGGAYSSAQSGAFGK